MAQANHGLEEPAVSPGSKRKAKRACNLRIDTHLSYKDDDPVTCKLVKGSPVTAIPPVPAKSEKRKKGPSAVPMDSLLAPKSVYTPPLPFRRDEPDWHPPRFGRGSRPHCPEELDLSVLPRRSYLVKNGRRVYARRGTVTLPTQIIPAGDPSVKVPPAAAPLSQVPKAQIPETQLPPAQVSPMKASPFRAIPSMTSTEGESFLGTMPFTDPQSPIYSAPSLSTDSLPQDMTRQRRKTRQKRREACCGPVDLDDRPQGPVTRRAPRDQDSLVRRREERDECSCTLCEDCCILLATLGMSMTIFLSVSTAFNRVGQWLVSLTPPEELRRY